eukprot:4927320-Prymnesium_polylepis.2
MTVCCPPAETSRADVPSLATARGARSSSSCPWPSCQGGRDASSAGCAAHTRARPVASSRATPRRPRNTHTHTHTRTHVARAALGDRVRVTQGRGAARRDVAAPRTPHLVHFAEAPRIELTHGRDGCAMVGRRGEGLNCGQRRLRQRRGHFERTRRLACRVVDWLEAELCAARWAREPPQPPCRSLCGRLVGAAPRPTASNTPAALSTRRGTPQGGRRHARQVLGAASARRDAPGCCRRGPTRGRRPPP